jgi:hypothetical protein
MSIFNFSEYLVFLEDKKGDQLIHSLLINHLLMLCSLSSQFFNLSFLNVTASLKIDLARPKEKKKKEKKK